MASALLQAHAGDEFQDEFSEVSDLQTSARSSALLQVRKAKVCASSVESQANEDGSQPCAHSMGRAGPGFTADLDEEGYQRTAKTCCHNQMRKFVQREIERQGLTICDLSDLHGFVHWYDCDNDDKTFAEMQAEIAGVEGSTCPWLATLAADCPRLKKGENCFDEKPCRDIPLPIGHPTGKSAELDEDGYAAVALRCCYSEMEEFVLREIGRQRFSVCDDAWGEGSLQGFLRWFDCTDDGQTYEKLRQGIATARHGIAPLCPWLTDRGLQCDPDRTGTNCPWTPKIDDVDKPCPGIDE